MKFEFPKWWIALVLAMIFGSIYAAIRPAHPTPLSDNDYLAYLEDPGPWPSKQLPKTLLEAAKKMKTLGLFGIVTRGVEKDVFVKGRGDKVLRPIRSWRSSINVGQDKVYLFKTQSGYNLTNVFTGFSCVTAPGTITIFSKPKGFRFIDHLLIGEIDSEKVAFGGIRVDLSGNVHVPPIAGDILNWKKKNKRWEVVVEVPDYTTLLHKWNNASVKMGGSGFGLQNKPPFFQGTLEAVKPFNKTLGDSRGGSVQKVLNLYMEGTGTPPPAARGNERVFVKITPPKFKG